MGVPGLLIIGNGGAALSAISSARVSGYCGEIHLVSDCLGPAFNPMLSPYFLKGIISWEGCFPFGPHFYAAHEVSCHFGAGVESLDTINREAILNDGKRIAYTRCLIATGATPVIPPVPGLRESGRAFLLRTPSSAQKLDEAIPSAKRVLVLGASFVGLKVAEILVKRGLEVVLLDVADQVLPRGAHPISAAIVRSLFESHGIDVRLGCTMEGMEGAGEGVTCRFSNDVIEEADLVVVCTGVRPNIGFIDPEWVDIDQALLVDDRMETSMCGLYAAGDASQATNLLTGRREWLGTWENACRQGRVAGAGMAGRDASYPGSMPQNIGPFFDWTYAQIGDVGIRGDSVLCRAFGDPLQGGHVVLAFRSEVLLGANLINCTRLAGRLRRAILGGRRWDESARDPLSLEAFEKSLDAMSNDLRFIEPRNGR